MADNNDLDEELVDRLKDEIDDVIEELLEQNTGKEKEVHEAFQRVARTRYNMQKPPDEEQDS